MLEILEGLLKGFGLLLRAFVEGGFLDVSLSGSGRFCIRLFYPPHWFKPVFYPKPIERCVGLVMWGAFAYAAYVLCY